MKLPQKTACIALVSLTAIAGAASPAMAVTTWNWSFSRDSSTYGSGTFTTADVTPTANVDIQVTGISGSITEQGSTFSITALNGISDNIFLWDGSGSSSLLVRDKSGSGISFTTTNGNYKLENRDNYDNSIVAARSLDTPTTSWSFTTSSVQPVVTPSGAAAAPGPLPLFGAAAAFGASRRLRQRLKAHKSTALG